MYTTITPPTALAPYILNFWHTTDTLLNQEQAIHSDGCISILLVISGESVINGVSIHAGGFLIGPQTTSHLWHFKTSTLSMVGARLTPLGAKHLTNIPLKYIKNQCIELQEVVNFSTLRTKVITPKLDPLQRVYALCSWLENHFNKANYQLPTAFSSILMQIDTQPRSIKLANMYDKLGLNSRRVERAFIESIGISAKEYATLVEVFNSRNVIKHNPNKPLTDIAYDLEYVDQSHFIRQFKKVMQITPKQYRARLAR
ncbi:AraC family transcriptional regulator [Pseudoalteromonas luteoviolacea]|uniref:HTH araC/xylS-type domain-containing protein n=1 Tax=Pseudoalteromonas luteoviolacea NCIMB 1942 TaxID=1365253 RepID=A0A167CTQ3_9GAMM|nr:helix-turn-helix domain-containing protein [Pseudoalteromonas luteoviolacea]KZN48052.1 hypothetical protein N482_08630 [Pseudoalteromonas luteoviolacea NCIMB 1942]KZX01357.1 hypothetical protein JL49_06490 [Pseudoalteromonas luteoviolacea]